MAAILAARACRSILDDETLRIIALYFASRSSPVDKKEGLT
jgi:hypothetical protein